MADYGFRVFGENGSIQFSNNIKNLCLADSGVSTDWILFGGLIQTRRWYFSHTRVGSSIPLIAVAATSATTPFGLSISGNTYTWSFLTPTNVNEMRYYIFDEVATNPGGYGIVVYANDGSIAYHSSRLPLRIAPPLITSDMEFNTWAEVPATQIGPVAENYTFAAGRVYAVIFGNAANYRTYIYLGAGNYSFGVNGVAAAVSGNIIATGGLWTSRESATTTAPNSGREVYNKRRTIIPIDVTHY